MFKRQFYHETCWNIMFSHIFRGLLSATETRPLLPKSLASPIVGDDIVTYIYICMYTVYYVNIDNGDNYDHFNYMILCDIVWYYVILCVYYVYYMYVYVYIICMYIII